MWRAALEANLLNLMNLQEVYEQQADFLLEEAEFLNLIKGQDCEFLKKYQISNNSNLSDNDLRSAVRARDKNTSSLSQLNS
jgi:hypothetical protein